MSSYQDKKIFIFDIDNTIADSYGPVHRENAKILCELLSLDKIVVFATDRNKESIEENVIDLLPCGRGHLPNIHMLPAGGAAMYSWQNENWKEIFAERIGEIQEDAIVRVYNQALVEVDKDLIGKETFILNKNSLMLSCSALLPTASKQERLEWDPNQVKRKKIMQLMRKELQGFDIGIGGSATINITMPHVDKAYGVEKLFDILDLNKKDALFVGDAIYPGGNDFCILKTSIDTLKVDSPEDMVVKCKAFLN